MVLQIARAFWSAAILRRFFEQTSNVDDRRKIVFYVHRVSFKLVNGFNCGRRNDAFEPACRTPRVLIWDSNQSMINGILMDVIQSRQIRTVKRELRIPKVVPDSSIRYVVVLTATRWK